MTNSGALFEKVVQCITHTHLWKLSAMIFTCCTFLIISSCFHWLQSAELITAQSFFPITEEIERHLVVPSFSAPFQIFAPAKQMTQFNPCLSSFILSSYPNTTYSLYTSFYCFITLQINESFNFVYYTIISTRS